MIRFLTLFILLWSSTAYADYKIKGVVDGDTVIIEAPFLPSELGDSLSLRILGIDTPESGFRAKCENEKRRALAAKEFTKNEIANAKEIEIHLKGWDKYGGRVLGDIELDDHFLSDKLLDNGYAVAYDGERKRSIWCKKK